MEQLSLFEKQKSTDWKWTMKDDYPKENQTLTKMLESGSSVLSVSKELGETRQATSKCYRRGINKIRLKIQNL